MTTIESRRAAIRPWWCAPALLLAAAHAPCADYHRFAPPAAWVDEAQPEYSAAEVAGAAPNGAWFVLLDRQVNVVANGDDYYQHVAVKMLNAAAVGEFSRVDIEVDPEYQTLDIHRLQVVRRGAITDQRPLARITELPQETDLANKVYNGRYNVNVLLTDVQVGDVIEYAYTLHSRDRIFAGHYAARLETGWSVPIHVQRVRIAAPPERALRFRASDGGLPEPRVRAGRRELLLDWRDRPAFTGNLDTPGWYFLRPYLEISDLEDWGSVGRLVDPLYRVPRNAGPGVAAAVTEIRAAGGTKEEQALRALQYVQERIRYASIAIGRGSYEPTAPQAVLDRLFGDCKDKSLLLAAMLTELGVQSNVALVNSGRGRALDGMLPTPYAFDHAIVRARIGESVYWLDPTNVTQYAPLATTRPADFERAFVAGSASVALETIPKPGTDSRVKDVVVTLDLRAGIEAPGTLTVATTYLGSLADAVRALLSLGSQEQRRSDYETYVARWYPSARSDGDLEVDDDRARDTVTVRERYRLESPFAPNDDGVLVLELHADELYAYGEPLGAGGRDVPLALEYPIHLKQRVRVLLPDEWPVKAATASVDGAAFRYRGAVQYAAKALQLTYDYQALADHVEPSDLARFEADRARMFDDLGYELTYNKRIADPTLADLAVAPLPLLAMLLAFGLSVWGAIRYGYRYDPEPRRASETAPVGIKGWLLVPALSVIVVTSVLAWVTSVWAGTIVADVWRNLPMVVHESYSGSVHYTVIAILASSVVLTVASVLMAVLFFTRRTSAPAAFITVAWLGSAYGLAVGVWGIVSGLDTETELPRLIGETVRDLIGTLIWTFYMLSSRRVAATFVKRPRALSRPGSA